MYTKPLSDLKDSYSDIYFFQTFFFPPILKAALEAYVPETNDDETAWKICCYFNENEDSISKLYKKFPFLENFSTSPLLQAFKLAINWGILVEVRDFKQHAVIYDLLTDEFSPNSIAMINSYNPPSKMANALILLKKNHLFNYYDVLKQCNEPLDVARIVIKLEDYELLDTTVGQGILTSLKQDKGSNLAAIASTLSILKKNELLKSTSFEDIRVYYDALLNHSKSVDALDVENAIVSFKKSKLTERSDALKIRDLIFGHENPPLMMEVVISYYPESRLKNKVDEFNLNTIAQHPNPKSCSLILNLLQEKGLLKSEDDALEYRKKLEKHRSLEYILGALNLMTYAGILNKINFDKLLENSEIFFGSE